MIADFSIITFLLAPFALVFFLFKKNLFYKWFHVDFSRKKITAIFTAIFIASFTSIGLTADPTARAEEKSEPLKVEVLEQKESSVSNFEEAVHSSVFPISIQTPIPTPSNRAKVSSASTPNPSTQPSEIREAKLAPIPKLSGAKYQCSCSKTCSNMSSCDEAYFQLSQCGCSERDGDEDGVPCESICPGG